MNKQLLIALFVIGLAGVASATFGSKEVAAEKGGKFRDPYYGGGYYPIYYGGYGSGYNNLGYGGYGSGYGVGYGGGYGGYGGGYGGYGSGFGSGYGGYGLGYGSGYGFKR